MRCEVVPGSPRLIVSSPSALFPSGRSGSHSAGSGFPASASPDTGPEAGTPGRIARVAEHGRKPGRYRVKLTDGREWLVDAEALTAAGALRKGQELDAATVLRLEANHRLTTCADRALGMLARARRTRREIEQQLRRVEPHPEYIEQALRRLEERGLLDDAAVARAEAAARFRRGEGAGRIRQVLRRKGVADDVAKAAVRDVALEEQIDDTALCREAGEKRLRALRAHAPDVQRRRLIGFLLRRGFPGHVVQEVVRALVPRASTWHE